MMECGKVVVVRMRVEVSDGPSDLFDFAVNMGTAVVFDPRTKERIIP